MSGAEATTSDLPDFKALLKSIVKRPAMYTDKSTLHALSVYLEGYDHAWGDLRQGYTPLTGWGHWICLRYLIYHSAWSWERVLLHVYGSDQAAIEAMPQLYDEFLAERELLGLERIYDELKRQLIAKYGRDWHEPETTNTTFEN